MRKGSGRVSNTRSELWEKGGLSHFLVTSHFVQGHLPKPMPEQPHLRNRVTTRQKTLIPHRTPVKAVHSVAESSSSPQPEKPQQETSHPQRIWTQAHTRLRVQATLASIRLCHVSMAGIHPLVFSQPEIWSLATRTAVCPLSPHQSPSKMPLSFPT